MKTNDGSEKNIFTNRYFNFILRKNNYNEEIELVILSLMFLIIILLQGHKIERKVKNTL